MLESIDITFSYNGHKPHLLDHVSLAVAPGECVAIDAPSGRGKSTWCHILAGYLQPLSGQVLCDGAPLPRAGVNPVQLIAQHPERMMDPLVRVQKSLAEVGQVSEELLDMLGVDPSWLMRYPSELSGGELQRICIARALAVHPRYLICDEISTMLDAVTQAYIWEALTAYAAENHVGMIAVTHSRSLRMKVATRCVTLP